MSFLLPYELQRSNSSHHPWYPVLSFTWWAILPTPDLNFLTQFLGFYSFLLWNVKYTWESSSVELLLYYLFFFFVSCSKVIFNGRVFLTSIIYFFVVLHFIFFHLNFCVGYIKMLTSWIAGAVPGFIGHLNFGCSWSHCCYEKKIYNKIPSAFRIAQEKYSIDII